MQAILFIVLVATAAAADTKKQPAQLTPEQKAKAQAFGMECMLKTGASLEAVNQAKKGNFADDEALKKFILCFFQKTGILTKEGKLNEEVALAKLPADVDKEAVKKVLEECKMKSGKNKADTAFEIYKCYYKATPTHVSV